MNQPETNPEPGGGQEGLSRSAQLIAQRLLKARDKLIDRNLRNRLINTPLDSHPGKYRMVLEHFDDTKGQRKKNCLQEEKRTGGNKYENSDFCLTFKSTRTAGQAFEETRYCMITSSSDIAGGYNNLICPLGRTFFDSDRLYGVKTDSPEFVELSPELTVTAKKFSCSRLDR